MAVLNNTTTTKDINVTAREIDFVTRFSRNWEHLMDIMSIIRPIEKQPGTILKAKYAAGTLENGTVAEGDTIPYSKFTVSERDYGTITLEKYAKLVTAEAIAENGYDAAIAMTDNEFLYELQNNVTDRFYTYLRENGTLKFTEGTFQMALSLAKGKVENEFKKMHKTATEVIAFCNVVDVYRYIGAANITVQNQFGFEYVKDFMGYSTVFLLGDNEIPQGTVIATPAENINLYYINPSASDFSRSGLVYTTAGDTNLIGFHTEGNYGRASSESFAILGMTLFAEYVNAIAIATVGSSEESIGLNITEGTVAVGGKITITADEVPDGTTVTWSSSNTSVATVSNGIVTGVSEGTATITAKAGNAAASCEIIVTAGA